jgi:imidazoleglycerol-phosphate dehydratase
MTTTTSPAPRTATIARKTKETDITLVLRLDDATGSTFASGVPFLDHMLDAMARHGRLGVNVTAKGDLDVDLHHTVEDVGIVLGEAFHEALGDRTGIRRYGDASVPMDEARARVVLDLGGRPHPQFEGVLPPGRIGNFDTELVPEFFAGFARGARANVHVIFETGANRHHIVEAAFKAFGLALAAAVDNSPRYRGANSTKGMVV